MRRRVSVAFAIAAVISSVVACVVCDGLTWSLFPEGSDPVVRIGEDLVVWIDARDPGTFFRQDECAEKAAAMTWATADPAVTTVVPRTKLAAVVHGVRPGTTQITVAVELRDGPPPNVAPLTVTVVP